MESNLRYLNEKEVSRLTSIPLSTLRNQRARGEGFPYSKFGRLVRYKLDDIVEKLESGRVELSDSKAD